MEIRSLRDDEYEILKTFLYEAIYVPEGCDRPPFDIVYRPELTVYYDSFGSAPADNALVLDDDGRICGCCWSRIMDDYGHVSDDTPSLAISLLPEYRGRGYGTRLLSDLLDLLRSRGFSRASLAVQKANYAVRMYEKEGFKTIDENDEEYIMVCML